MAWEAYTSDILKDLGSVSCGSNCTVSGRLAYRLYCDMDDIDNPLVRLEITYLHLRLTLSGTVGTNYWNASTLGWFLGAYPETFDQSQFELNEQRDEDGNYLNPFAWPYVSTVSGTNDESGGTYTFANSILDSNLVVWDNSPIVAATVLGNLFSFSGVPYDYGQTVADISSSSQVVLWGDCFANTSKYTGVNANGQNKVYVTSTTFDIATSSTKNLSDGTNLTYSDEFVTDVSSLEVVSPYTGNECFAYVELPVSELETKGLIRYDPEYFSSDGVSSPYVVDGFVVPFSWWTRVQGTQGHSTLTRDTSSEKEVTLEYQEIDVPEYDPPEPVKPVDDNEVFRLKKQYTSDGHVIVDQNGRPILSWVKCERMGQE